jgi:hypothetical protein
MSRKDDERSKDCITNYLDTLNFARQLDEHGCRVARSVTRAFVRVDSMKPELRVEVMRYSQRQFSLTFIGFMSEISLEKLYTNFLDLQARDPGFACITALSWNTKAASITATIDATAALPQQDVSAPRKMSRSRGKEAYAPQRDRRRRASGSGGLGGGGGKIRVNASEDLDMSRVEEAHKASVAEVGVGMLYYQTVMPDVKRRPVVVPTDAFYKLIFYDFDMELNLSTLYRRTLGEPGVRDNFFSAVRSVGLEPAINALVVRIGKRQRV